MHKGDDTFDLGNFRLISVISVVAITLVKLITNHLCEYLESHQLFHGHQGAYGCSRSSEQILLYTVDTLFNSLVRGRLSLLHFWI